MTYARSRLWLGISAVGVLVLSSVGLLVCGIPSRFENLKLSESVLLAVWVLTGIVVLTPFDVIGGFVLPRQFRRHSQSGLQFAGSWLRGVLVHGAILYVSLLAILRAGQAAGPACSTLVVLALQILLILMQKQLARLSGRLAVQRFEPADPQIQSLPPISLADHRGSDFTGSIVGWPGFEEVIIPAFWQSDLTGNELKAQIIHRTAAIRSGSRTRGLLLAICVNTLSFAACSSLPTAGVTSVGTLVATTLYLTVLSFVWLLILPRYSRQGVFEADRYAFDHGLTFTQIKTAAERIDVLYDNEKRRSRSLESVFHPIPCVKRRVSELSLRLHTLRGCWHAARTTLFLSWSCGNLLSRAVHCNIGQPELWVLLPAD